MREILVVMGSHPDTRNEFDWNRTDCDILVFNEAMAERNAWVKRADYVTQLHLPIIWRNPGNRNDPKHYEWLKSGDTPIIYMQEEYEDVPKSRKYPIDEIVKMGRRYFTSSAAYSIALGVHLGYQKIEIYGVEMATQTEYSHQRPGVAYWIGFAEGAGVEVNYHGAILDSPLYGYEGDIKLPYEYFDKRRLELEDKTNIALEAYNESTRQSEAAVKQYAMTGTEPDTVKKLLQKGAELGSQFGLQDGARQEVLRYKKKADTQIAATKDYLFSRQEFEHAVTSFIKERDNAIINAKVLAANCETSFKFITETNNKNRRKIRLEKFSKTVLDYIKESVKVGMFDGAIRENKVFMEKLDQLALMTGGAKSVEVLQEAYREKMPV
jgi:hypothetical protein